MFNLGVPVPHAKVFMHLWGSEKNISEFFTKLNLFIFNRIVFFFLGFSLSYFLGVKTFMKLW